MTIHPRFGTLVDYAQSELSNKHRARISAHLISCPECRATLGSIKEIGVLAREAYSMDPPADTMRKVHERWQAGQRIILPTAEPAHSRRPQYWRILSAAAALVLLVCAIVFFRPATARADRSELRFTPAAPQAGDTIAVEYVATSWLGAAKHLYLRARYRTANGQSYSRGALHHIVTRLERRGGGSYGGSFVLPDSVIYAVFAVEDSGGRRVDSNGRRLWELLIHEDGKPTFQALVQKENDLMGRNWEAGLAAARVATELYPESPMAWYHRQSFVDWLNEVGSATSDSQESESRFHEFQSTLKGKPDLTGDDIAGMLWLGRIVNADTGSVAYWRRRLVEQAPAHPFAVQERVLDVIRRDAGDVSRTLSDLERLWQEVGPAHQRLARVGFGLAIQEGDSAQIMTWLERRNIVDPWRKVDNAMELLSVPSLRRQALARLRRELRQLTGSDDSRRSLDESRDDWESERRNEMSRIRTAIGNALVASGEITEGLSMLEQAAAGGWNLSVFQAIADARFQLGDSASGVAMLSRIAVDPSTDVLLADSIHNLGVQVLGAAAWLRMTEQARRLMYERTLAEASAQSPHLDIELADTGGTSISLSDILANQVAVVAFWSRFCAPSLAQLPELQQVAERLEAQGVSVVPITSEAVSADLDAFLAERGFDLPVYHDIRGEAIRAFNSWGTPMYYVLDAQGRLRFDHVQLEDVERFATALNRDPEGDRPVGN